MTHARIEQAMDILEALGMPRAQLNERSALCLLALVDVRPKTDWQDAHAVRMGVTPIIEWMKAHYQKTYAPNTRETIRRQTLHQFRDAGLVLYNPDKPNRAVNSPAAVYQIAPEALALLQKFGSAAWPKALGKYMATNSSLAAHYAQARNMAMVPVQVPGGIPLTLSPGDHSELIKSIIEQFGPRFVPGAHLIYAGDTGQKVGCFDHVTLARLGVTVDQHGKMPDVVLYDPTRDWLILAEAVTSHGPVDGKRHGELSALFANATPGLVYVSAFPDRATMRKYLADIAWETEVWAADAPTHLIHFNGVRFLGPYDKK
jgi:adenine-specific DNA-methyltransferase